MSSILQVEKTDKAIVSRRKDGVVHLEFTGKGENINQVDSEKIFNARKKVDPTNTKQRLLVNLANNPVPDKDSRAFAKTEQMNELTLGMALIVDNLFNRVVGNFYLGVNRGNYPVKLFTQESDALKWLKKLNETETKESQ